MPILGIVASAKTGNLYMPAMDSIATYSAGATSAITFSSIPSTYKHLRLVMRVRDQRSGAPYSNVALSFNGAPSGTSYAFTQLFADSRSINTTPFEDSSSATNAVYLACCGTSPYVTNGSVYAYNIVDIFDYKDTSKFKGVQAVGGFIDQTSSYSIKSQFEPSITGMWASNSAISSIVLTPAFPNYAGSVRASLYGIKG